MASSPYAATMPQFVRDGVPTLTGFRRESVAPYVVLTVRDPLTVDADAQGGDIASFLDGAETVAQTGLFTTVTGTFEGTPVSVISGGSGAPEAELALMDLFNFTDATAVLRIGGCGAWHQSVKVGDLLISAGAVRDEGMSKAHVRAEYPAVADHQLVGFLAEAAGEIGAPHHVGILRSGDSEYTGWGRPGPGGYLQDEHAGLIDYWRQAGISWHRSRDLRHPDALPALRPAWRLGLFGGRQCRHRRGASLRRGAPGGDPRRAHGAEAAGRGGCVMTAYLSVEKIQKSYGKTRALSEVEIDMERGEFLALLGPSGCGKTTLLRIIAGLLEANGGRLVLDERDITDLPPWKRDIGLVFQNYALFPHMSVRQNVGFGLEMRKVDRSKIGALVDEALDVVRSCAEFADRRPSELSGGQQQQCRHCPRHRHQAAPAAARRAAE